MMQTTSPSSALWRSLVQPHASMKDADMRRRAQTLAAISLGLLVIIGALVAVGIANSPSTAVPGLIGVGLILASYILSRTQYALWGARLLVFGLVASMLISILVSPDISLLNFDVMFLLLPVLLALLLLDAQMTGIVAGLVVGGLVLVPIFKPGLDFAIFLAQFGAIALLSLLATITSYLRERDVTTIQKQSADLTRYSLTLETEARNMIATAQVGQAISATRDLNQLLKQVVDLIIERFPDVYHAQVFLIDDEGKVAVLRESTGEAGRELLAREHQLAVGSQSVIGQVTSLGEPQIVHDTVLDAVHHRNELLPNTRSEMALPLTAGGQMIGALDVQSTKPNMFGESEVRVFQTMADQLAVAIQNARLFERAQHDLQEIEVLNRRLTGEGWQRFRQSRGALTSGYEAGPGGIRPLPAGESAPETASDKMMRMPLTVRGEAVGVLDVTSRSGESPTEDVQAILSAVAERVALALDSTRLSESTLRQAEREQVLSRLSAELQATTDLDVILHVAAREASRALGTPRGFVHLVMEYGERTETE